MEIDFINQFIKGLKMKDKQELKQKVTKEDIIYEVNILNAKLAMVEEKYFKLHDERSELYSRLLGLV